MAFLKYPQKVILGDITVRDGLQHEEKTISIQAKLLQVLHDGGFSRLGGEGDIVVNTRVITTTKDDLERSIRDGRFREDLFYRINVITLSVPPLRERKEQILPLTHFFFDNNRKKYGKTAPSLSPQTLRYFQEYDWPGNVRELENIVKRVILFGEEQVIGQEAGHVQAQPATPDHEGVGAGLDGHGHALQRQFVVEDPVIGLV